MRDLAPRILTAALLLLGLVACSTDTPTAPERTPAPPPGSGGPSTDWNITVTADPDSVTVSSTQPSTITIRVRRADNGQPPPAGTTVVVSANLGEFGNSGSGVQSATVSLSGSGLAQLLYFARDILGTDFIQAVLESSFGAANIDVVEAVNLFITSVRPGSGPENGGTRIRIDGSGFTDPLRVDVGGVQARIDRVGPDGDFVRAFTGEVIDPATFFSTVSCDSNGDGVLNGARRVATTKDVRVTLASGGTASIPAAFTYEPDDTRCRATTPPPNPPRADFTFATNAQTVLFSNLSTPTSGLSFTWLFGDSTSSTEKDPVHTYVVPGTYNVTLRATNASGSSVVTKPVTVP